MEQNRRGITRSRQLEGMAVPSPNAEPQDDSEFMLTTTYYQPQVQPAFTQQLITEPATIPQIHAISLNSRKRNLIITDDVLMMKRRKSGVAAPQEPGTVNGATHAAMPPQMPEEMILIDDPFADFDFPTGDEADMRFASIELPDDPSRNQQPAKQ